MALLLSQARNVPQASAALKAGRWERSKWTGVELSDKTLGIIGLGRIGKLVAQRALAFGMKLVAYDPFVSEDRARQLSVELLPLEDLMARADFITLHLAKTPETAGLIDAAHAGQGQALAAGHQRRPGRHHRRGRRWRTRSRTAPSPVPRSTCSPPSRPPSRRCSSSTRWSSPRTWVPRPPRRRTRRATRSPTWSSWRSPGTSCPTRSTSRPPRHPRPCAPTCGLGRAAGPHLRRALRRVLRRDRDRVPGADRRVRHADPDAVGAQGLLHA